MVCCLVQKGQIKTFDKPRPVSYVLISGKQGQGSRLGRGNHQLPSLNLALILAASICEAFQDDYIFNFARTALGKQGPGTIRFRPKSLTLKREKRAAVKKVYKRAMNLCKRHDDGLPAKLEEKEGRQPSTQCLTVIIFPVFAPIRPLSGNDYQVATDP